MLKNLPVLVAALVLTVPATATAQSAADRTAVERAALDYIEGFYEGDTTKLMRSVHPDVHKYGFFIPRGQTAYRGQAMPWAEFLSYANRVRTSSRPTPASAPRGVQVLDVLDQIAAVKVTAWWGVDYLLLARYDGRWMIRQVLWQSPPR